MPLQTKYRPSSLKEIVGNKSVVDGLASMLDRELEDMPTAFLFVGPSGCGKTTFAHVLKTEFGCSDFDFHYFNASNTRGIDTIRDVAIKCQFKPMSGDVKIYVFDEIHGQTSAAQEAMLQLLEHPPTGVLFVLCTTEPTKLKVTLKRRCHQYIVQDLSQSQIKGLLVTVLDKEGVDGFSEKLIREICLQCKGSPGIALKMLDAVIDMTDVEKAIQILATVGVQENTVIDLCRTLIDKQIASDEKRWAKVSSILKNIEGDVDANRRVVLDYMSKVLLNGKKNDRVAEIISNFSDGSSATGKAGLVLSCYMSCWL